MRHGAAAARDRARNSRADVPNYDRQESFTDA
jgi:hypothetical protein